VFGYRDPFTHGEGIQGLGPEGVPSVPSTTLIRTSSQRGVLWAPFSYPTILEPLKPILTPAE
jgi:hypothetical protein